MIRLRAGGAPSRPSSTPSARTRSPSTSIPTPGSPFATSSIRAAPRTTCRERLADRGDRAAGRGAPVRLRAAARPSERGARRAGAGDHDPDGRSAPARRGVPPLLVLHAAARALGPRLRGLARARPLPRREVAVAVHVLVWLGVAVELVSCVGLLAMRNAIDRLHYAGTGMALGPALVA